MKFRCESCGKVFLRGDEGDNEKFCLRCVHEDLMGRDDYDENHNYNEEEMWQRLPGGDT